ncbi:hypothetical protein CBW18_20985, partial [Pedobacter sp. AJM]
MYFRIFTALFVIMGFIANAQVSEQQVEIRDILESVADHLPDDYDLTELVDVLMRYRKNPINLNQTNPDELKTIIFLSPLQISNFFSYIKENGNLINVLELQSIDGFDERTVQNLLPFVTLQDMGEYEKLSFKDMMQSGENDFLMRFSQILEKQKGFTDLPGNRYLGSAERFQSRYRYHYGTILSAAITLDKDAGE